MAKRDELIKEIELRLGGQMVDVELDPEHYDLSIRKALEKYRQRSENAVEESFITLDLVVDVADYTLPDEVIDVYTIYRRASGTLNGSGGADMEPFEAAYLNNYKQRSEEELLSDTYAMPWIKELALAYSKLMLAEARGKFNTIAGPQGGTSLNADALRSDAQMAIDKLDDELKTYTDGLILLLYKHEIKITSNRSWTPWQRYCL